MISSTASRDKEGRIHVSLSNISLTESADVTINLEGINGKQVSGRILTADKIDDYNTFENPEVIAPKAFKDAKIQKGALLVKIPAKSIVVLEIK